jgi:hypothetical protein
MLCSIQVSAIGPLIKSKAICEKCKIGFLRHEKRHDFGMYHEVENLRIAALII